MPGNSSPRESIPSGINELAEASFTAARQFISDLYTAAAPTRPGVLCHFPNSTAASPPAQLSPVHRQIWSCEQGFSDRPLTMDDFVPTMGTGSGTCMLAGALGCVEVERAGLYWPEPVITAPEQIDRFLPPPITAGRLGQVLEQTRLLDRTLDPRIDIRIIDFQSPFTTVEQMLGSEMFFLMPHDHPQRLHALMDIVTDFCIAFFQAQMQLAGQRCCPGSWPSMWFPKSAGIQMSDDNLCNVSPAIYDEFVVPYNNRIAEAFGGLFLHSCTIASHHLPSLAKLNRLSGLNCDISTSVSVGTLLDTFGHKVLIAPHAYINTNTNFTSYRQFMEACLADYKPGHRLFIYPCSVLYQAATQTELPFQLDEVVQAMSRFDSYRRRLETTA